MGDSQKRQIDHHRASRIKKNPVWIKNTMIQETYLQKYTKPTVPKCRKSEQITRLAKDYKLWERLDGICRAQATQGNCRFWNKGCQAWHLDWNPSVEKRMKQLIFIHSPEQQNREDMTTIIMNPSTADTPPTSRQAPTGSHDGDIDPRHWWNIIEEDGASETNEEEEITSPD